MAYSSFKRLQHRDSRSTPGDDGAFPLADPVKQPERQVFAS
jgi:hypothetical protein